MTVSKELVNIFWDEHGKLRPTALEIIKECAGLSELPKLEVMEGKVRVVNDKVEATVKNTPDDIRLLLFSYQECLDSDILQVCRDLSGASPGYYANVLLYEAYTQQLPFTILQLHKIPGLTYGVKLHSGF